MDNFDTQEEWQEFFNSTFPNGVSCFRADDLHFFAPVMRVIEVEDSMPTVRFYPAHISSKVAVVQIESIEEEKAGVLWKIQTGDGEPNWSFSKNFSEEIGNELRALREEDEELRKRYSD